MDKEIEKFQADLLQSVVDVKARRAARATQTEPTMRRDAEDAAIRRGIDADPDAAEIPAEVIKGMRPFSELVAQKRMGRPPKENPKEQVSVLYDADVVAAFRATGDGWEARINAALRAYLKEHPL